MMERLIERLDGQARNMSEMFGRCGVDTGQLATDRLGLTIAAAARSCLLCPAGRECRLWLDLHEKGERTDPPAFCPNGARILRARG